MTTTIGREAAVPRRAVALVFLLAAGLLVAQAQASRQLMLNGNESSHIRLMHSMVVLDTLAISHLADVSYYKGNFYSNKPPGFPMLVAPLYSVLVDWTGDRSLDFAFLYMKIVNALFGAATIALLFWLLSTWPISRASVLFGVTAATAGTIFPAYSALANSMPLSLLLAVVTLATVRWNQLHPDDGRARTIGLVAGSLAITTHYANLFFLFPLLAWIGIDVLRRREAMPLVLSALPLALLLAYNHVAFENAFTLSYSHYVAPSHVAWEGAGGSFSPQRMPRGLYGLLLSPSRGLFVLSPIALLGVWAAVRLVRERALDRVWLLAPIVSGILIVSCYALWHGGHSVGYRHILASGFVLAALGAFVFETLSRAGRGFALALLLVSSVSGLGSYLVQSDFVLIRETWKEEPADVHASYYPELLWPALGGLVGPSPEERAIAEQRRLSHARPVDPRRRAPQR